MLDEVKKAGRLNQLNEVIQEDQWRDFRCYIAHLWTQKKKLDAVLSETEQLLRNTYGYGKLTSQKDTASREKTEALLNATKAYVHKLAEHPGNAGLADSTGFAPEGVARAIVGLDQLERKLTTSDWEPDSLFGPKNAALSHLIGVMMRIPELKHSLNEITPEGKDNQHIAQLTKAWVQGRSLQDIAKTYFLAEDGDFTRAITNTCKAIYRTLTNSGPWGLSALSQMPTSGLDYENMDEDLKQTLNALPAMIYHGVRTPEAILMRMNSAPRTVAQGLGDRYKQEVPEEERSVSSARSFLHALDDQQWSKALPKKAKMSGADCREVWRVLSGEV